MPVIPKYDGPKVIPQYQPHYMQFQDTTRGMVPPEKFNGGAMAELALRFQGQQDTARLAGASADLERHIADTLYGVTDGQGNHTKGALEIEGLNALDPDENGNSLVDRTDQSIINKANEIAETLPANLRQRFLDGYVRNRSGQVYNQVASHVMQQNAKYGIEAMDNYVKNCMDTAMLSVQDLDAFATNLGNVEAAVREQARARGWSGQQVERLVHDTRSNTILNGMKFLYQQSETGDMEGNIQYANTLYSAAVANKWFNGEDILAAQQLAQTYDVRLKTEQFKGSLKGSQSRFASFGGVALSPDQQRAYGVNIFSSGILWQESGKQHFNSDGTVKIGAYANGKRPSDTKNWAYGIAQVTEGAAREGFRYLGWKWTEGDGGSWEKVQRDPNLNEAVGQAYFLKLVERYNGDMDKAVVAYNQGPGNVDKAISKGEKEGNSWLNHITPTAKNYLDRVKHFYATKSKGTVYDASGKPVSIFDPNHFRFAPEYATPKDVEEQAKYMFPQFTQNPRMLQGLIDAGMGVVNNEKKQDQLEQQNAIAEATNALMQNGGRFDLLKESLLQRMTPDTQEQLKHFAHAIWINDDSGSIELYTAYALDPTKWDDVPQDMLESTLQAMPGKFREAMRMKYYEHHQNLLNAATTKAQLKNAADAGTYYKEFIPKLETVKTIAKGVWGDKFKKDDEWTNSIYYMIQQAIADEQQRAGQVYQDPAVLRSRVENWMNTNLTVPNRFLWGEHDVNLLDLKYKDLPAQDPSDVRPVLTLVAKGMNNHRGVKTREPTENEVVNAGRYLFMFQNPPQMSDVDFSNALDPSIVQYVRRQAETYGRPDINGPDLIRDYLLARLQGITPEIAERAIEQETSSMSELRRFRNDFFSGARLPRILSYE